jgi:hypothetical protein
MWQLAQDDDGTFDLRSDLGLNDSLDDLTTPTDPTRRGQPIPTSSHNADSPDLESGFAKDTHPQPTHSAPGSMPTTAPQRRAPQPDPLPPDVQTRGSLDGETMFAVGEEEWSDGEVEPGSGDDERGGLVGKGKKV